MKHNVYRILYFFKFYSLKFVINSPFGDLQIFCNAQFSSSLSSVAHTQHNQPVSYFDFLNISPQSVGYNPVQPRLIFTAVLKQSGSVSRVGKVQDSVCSASNKAGILHHLGPQPKSARLHNGDLNGTQNIPCRIYIIYCH